MTVPSPLYQALKYKEDGTVHVVHKYIFEFKSMCLQV